MRPGDSLAAIGVLLAAAVAAAWMWPAGSLPTVPPREPPSTALENAPPSPAPQTPVADAAPGAWGVQWTPESVRSEVVALPGDGRRDTGVLTVVLAGGDQPTMAFGVVVAIARGSQRQQFVYGDLGNGLYGPGRVNPPGLPFVTLRELAPGDWDIWLLPSPEVWHPCGFRHVVQGWEESRVTIRPRPGATLLATVVDAADAPQEFADVTITYRWPARIPRWEAPVRARTLGWEQPGYAGGGPVRSFVTRECTASADGATVKARSTLEGRIRVGGLPIGVPLEVSIQTKGGATARRVRTLRSASEVDLGRVVCVR